MAKFKQFDYIDDPAVGAYGYIEAMACLLGNDGFWHDSYQILWSDKNNLLYSKNPQLSHRHSDPLVAFPSNYEVVEIDARCQISSNAKFLVATTSVSQATSVNGYPSPPKIPTPAVGQSTTLPHGSYGGPVSGWRIVDKAGEEIVSGVGGHWQLATCDHTYKTYQGFRESYEYCTKCDEKRGAT